MSYRDEEYWQSKDMNEYRIECDRLRKLATDFDIKNEIPKTDWKKFLRYALQLASSHIGDTDECGEIGRYVYSYIEAHFPEVFKEER